MKLLLYSRSKLFSALLACLFLLLGTSLRAQDVAKGIVVDPSGVPVIGASVIQAGTMNGTITEVDGSFQLRVPSGSRLEVSCIGYVTKTVTAAANLKIVLEEDNEILSESVAIGYGSVKKSNLTSAVSSMNSSSIDDRPMARAEQALQGQLAGVQVRITNAEPGADPEIRVRGAASISAGNDPLYVIDGVPQTSMSGLNPNDIASIEVLKDAASSAIYGSRGSNGVVLVTTKTGQKGKAKVSVTASYGVATLEKKLDLLSAKEWIQFNIEYADANYLTLYPQGSISDDNATRLANVGQSSPIYKSNSRSVVLDDRWFNYVSEDVRRAHTYTATDEQLSLLDWQKHMYKPAGTQNYNVSVSGASDNTTYMYSVGYLNQGGLNAASNYQRINARSNVETKVSDWLTVGMRLAPSYVINRGSGFGNGKDSQGHLILTSAPVSGPGVGYNNMYEPNVGYLWAKTTAFPREYAKDRAPRTRTFSIQSSAFVRITPIKDLTVEGTASANYSNSQMHQFINGTKWNSSWLTKDEGESSSVTHTNNNTLNTLIQVVANYDKTFGSHELAAMLGASSETGNMGYSTDQRYNNLANDEIRGTFSATGATTSPYVSRSNVTEKTKTQLYSLFGRLQYNYAGRYMASASLRYDGYSRFGDNNKWGLFPSVSAGWNIADEEFFKGFDLPWWNTLKLRVSYGQTGNYGIGESAAYSTLTLGSYADENAYYAGSFGNTHLGWEKTHSTDIAFDFGFLDNRIQMSVDWYTKTTTDLLYSVPVPAAYGTTTTTDNLGEVYNSGLEIELNTHNINHKNFQWNTSFNLSYNHNEVKKLGTENTTVYRTTNGATNVLEVGKTMYYFYGVKCDGVWMNQAEIDAYTAQTGLVPKFNGTPVKPGDLKYVDQNGDGNVVEADDRTYLGKPTPDVTYGMTNTFKWKNWDASVLITAQTGGKIWGNLARAIDRANAIGPGDNQMGWWTDCWKSEDDPGNGWLPSIKSSVALNTDSRFVESSDYLRVKNLTIGYTFPMKKWLQSARLYLSVENLLILDSYYHGYTPEASNNGTSGIDYGAYPSARTFTFGLNINF